MLLVTVLLSGFPSFPPVFTLEADSVVAVSLCGVTAVVRSTAA